MLFRVVKKAAELGRQSQSRSSCDEFTSRCRIEGLQVFLGLAPGFYGVDLNPFSLNRLVNSWISSAASKEAAKVALGVQISEALKTKIAKHDG